MKTGEGIITQDTLHFFSDLQLKPLTFITSRYIHKSRGCSKSASGNEARWLWQHVICTTALMIIEILEAENSGKTHYKSLLLYDFAYFR